MSRGPLPRVLVALARRILPDERVEEVLADLREGFARRAERMGRKRARRWLWKEMAGLAWWLLGSAGFRAGRPRTEDFTNGRDGMTMWARDLVQDLRFGVRALRRRPGLTVTAVLVLGIGIGASTTVSSLVDRIFLDRPAEVDEPHRLVRLFDAWEGGGGSPLGNPDYEYYRENATTLSGLAAYSGARLLVASYSVDGESSDQLRVERVSDNFFDVLGVSPVLGRDFLPEENVTPGTHPVVVLSHDFWQRAFGGDPAAVGRTMTLNGSPYTIVGVLPDAYEGIAPDAPTADAWVPIAMSGELQRAEDTAWWERIPGWRSNWLAVVGRLAPGVSFETAEAELQALHAGLEYEGKSEDGRLWVRRQWIYSPGTAKELAGLSRILGGVVAIVLAIAAANLAVLLLARSSTRDRELGIRAAMGASRGRITRQLLAESLLLGGAGGLLGVGIAYGASDLAAALMPISFHTTSFAPDWPVVLAGLLLAGATSVVVGLAPALHARRRDLREAIHGGSKGHDRSLVRGALVVGQLSLSVMLVAGAFLFARSFWAASTQDVGFETDNRLVLTLQLQSLGYDEARARAFVDEGLSRLEALPGVEAATTTLMTPFRGEWRTTFETPPGATPNSGESVRTGMNVVSPRYFEVMGMEIVRGRPLGEADVEGAPLAVVVNEALADAVWPGLDPLGRTLPIRSDESATVVGVAANANYYDLGEEPVPHLWAPYDQYYGGAVSFVLETSRSAGRLAQAAQSTLRELDPHIAFASVTTLDEQVSSEVARYEVTAVLVGLLGVVALALAAVGLYGLVAFLVAQRTREFGVRMALGADGSTVARGVMRSSGRLALWGLAFGTLGALALRRFTESFLYQVEPADPLPLAGAAAVLALVTVLASLVPARRASRVDPMGAIRAE